MSIQRLSADLTSSAYRDFLTAMLHSEATFSLVWRDQLTFGASAAAVRHDLTSFEQTVRRTMVWPGTRLYDPAGLATVVLFSCSLAALPVLLRPGALFSWEAPDYPEDLAFYDHSGACSFASVAHEGDAWALSPSVVLTLSPLVELHSSQLSPEDLRLLQGAA